MILWVLTTPLRRYNSSNRIPLVEFGVGVSCKVPEDDVRLDMLLDVLDFLFFFLFSLGSTTAGGPSKGSAEAAVG